METIYVRQSDGKHDEEARQRLVELEDAVQRARWEANALRLQLQPLALRKAQLEERCRAEYGCDTSELAALREQMEREFVEGVKNLQIAMTVAREAS